MNCPLKFCFFRLAKQVKSLVNFSIWLNTMSHSLVCNTKIPIYLTLSDLSGLTQPAIWSVATESGYLWLCFFFNQLYIIVLIEQTANVATFPLKSFLPTDHISFYRYNGSLTTPGCNEAVTWTVFVNDIEISADQVDRIHCKNRKCFRRVTFATAPPPRLLSTPTVRARPKTRWR